MKKLTKTFIAVAAVSAVSAAMAASAMAMTMTAEYADGTVTLKDVKSTGASQTLLVLSQNETVTSENANNIVKQIDQTDDSTSFSTVPVGTLADGTYYVRIGGTDGTLQTATFKVGEDEPGVEYEEILIGDVDAMPGVGISDASAIASFSANVTNAMNAKVGTKRTAEDGSSVTIGDVDAMPGVGISDASAVASFSANVTNAMNAKVGTTVKVQK